MIAIPSSGGKTASTISTCVSEERSVHAQQHQIYYQVMKITLPLILVISGALAPSLLSDPLVVTSNGTIVRPPPAGSSNSLVAPPPPVRLFNNGTVVPPPHARGTRLPPNTAYFFNGATVQYFSDVLLITDRWGNGTVVNRWAGPQTLLPGNGCAWTNHWLDTHDCHSSNWVRLCITYFNSCR